MFLLWLFLLTPVSASGQTGWRDIAYADMAKMPLVLKKVDSQGVFVYFYKAVPAPGLTAPLPPDLKLQVLVGGQAVPLPVGPDGRFELPIRQDWLDAGAKVQVNQPKDRVGVSFTLNSRVPPGTQMSYGQLTESGPVLERGIKEMAGLMSFMAPGVKQFLLTFDPLAPQSVTVALPDGTKKVWKTDAKGVVHLPWERDWAGARVVLSAPLKGIDPVLK